MNPKEIIRTVSIAFAEFLTDECIYNLTGYYLPDQLTPEGKEDDKEYQVDEVYDYWFENIYLKNQN